MHLVHDWQGNPLVLQPDTFWHLTTPNGFFQNNARVNKGIVLSISAAAQIPGLENAVSPYSPCKGKRSERSHLGNRPHPNQARTPFATKILLLL